MTRVPESPGWIRLHSGGQIIAVLNVVLGGIWILITDPRER